MKYHGEFLLISELQHEWLATRFPEVDLYSNYREMDSWLAANPRRRPKRNMDAFIHRWLARQKRREESAEYVVSDGVRVRLTAADYRTGRA